MLDSFFDIARMMRSHISIANGLTRMEIPERKVMVVSERHVTGGIT